jgi:hypothetical protein
MFRDPKAKNMSDLFSQQVDNPASYFANEQQASPDPRVQAIRNKMSDEQAQTIASRNNLNREVSSGGIIDNSGPIEDGQLAQTLESRDRLNREVSSGGIVDKSGPIGAGMVESGKMTQDQFDKDFSTEKLDPNKDTEIANKFAEALKPKDLGPAAEAYRFGDVGAGVQTAPNSMQARRAAIAKLSGGGI